MKAFNNLKVGTKLIAGFILVALVATAVGAVGISKIKQIDAADTKLYEKVTVPLSDLATMAVMFQRIRINLRDAIETDNPAERANYVTTIGKLRQQISDKSDQFEKNIISNEGRSTFKEYRTARAGYITMSEQVLSLAQAGRKAEAQALLKGNAKQAAVKTQELLDKLLLSKEEQGKLTSQENARVAYRASTVMVVLVVLGALLAVGLGLVIARTITVPLGQAVQVANRLAQGDLTATVEVGSNDETGQLMKALNEMVQSLRNLVAQTVQISSSIASASTQLHATSDQIATGAEEVAAQVGSVATASEEMAATSADIAHNCTMAADASRKSTESATSGAGIVQETIAGMSMIAERVRQTSNTVQALGTSSQQIGEIVGTIEDIADQTNLLALNAAIEAARAGDQGRGFAVVADEVRNLAERTTKATKEIAGMIRSIQKETAAAVAAMEEGVREVEKGSAAAQRSGSALEDILNRINEATLQVSQIATAAEEQTATTGEVTGNIQQITEVVVQTARGAEETADAAAQLAAQATGLQSLVGRFRLTA
ncbi:methyl-accepting chemotaxis protein [Geomonas silvestris]|uniref:Methyl-accepting chemotaxis protein n=1 Tax=Geomonas silvestris TaxID=2740184 RepID=A0A6V8MH18_9BACT|nr:methyl-accepting chemotaxis protein [Geomonas silvestris]GFO59276.1 methyl-accepting chemotaxis protein [Geomonas silvestris]